MLHLSDAAGVGTPLRDANVLLCLLRLRSVRSAIIAANNSCQMSEMVHNEGPRALLCCSLLYDGAIDLTRMSRRAQT